MEKYEAEKFSISVEQHARISSRGDAVRNNYTTWLDAAASKHGRREGFWGILKIFLTTRQWKSANKFLANEIGKIPTSHIRNRPYCPILAASHKPAC